MVTNGRTPLLRRSRVTANTCGNRSVAVVIVDNDSRTRWAALLALTAGLTLTAAGVALSAAALSAAAWFDRLTVPDASRRRPPTVVRRPCHC